MSLTGHRSKTPSIRIRIILESHIIIFIIIIIIIIIIITIIIIT